MTNSFPRLDTLAGPFENVPFTAELAELDYEVQSISIDDSSQLSSLWMTRANYYLRVPADYSLSSFRAN